MNITNYYWYFQSAIPSRICDDIAKYDRDWETVNVPETVNVAILSVDGPGTVPVEFVQGETVNVTALGPLTTSIPDPPAPPDLFVTLHEAYPPPPPPPVLAPPAVPSTPSLPPVPPPPDPPEPAVKAPGLGLGA